VILQLFKRSLKEHFGFHLFIPVVLIFAISAWSEPRLRDGTMEAWAAFARHWPVSHIGNLIEVYLAFFLVVGWSIKLAGDVQSTRVETVRDTLPSTKRYFAIGVIPMREWFEPNTAVYLSTVIHHQLMLREKFSHERVLLFRRERDLKAVSVSYLDQPYAKAFAAIHKQFDIPLSYLTPDKFVSLIGALTVDQRRALRTERKSLSWLRAHLGSLPVAWTFRAIKPFVLLEQIDGTFVTMRFDKRGRTLTLSHVDDEGFVDAAKALIDRISATVYKRGTKELKEEHNFISYLQL
jgi:uncharacterized membrane protein YidH (DUF202 family)